MSAIGMRLSCRERGIMLIWRIIQECLETMGTRAILPRRLCQKDRWTIRRRRNDIHITLNLRKYSFCDPSCLIAHIVNREVSFLIRVPTKLPPINQYVKQAFQPTQTVLNIVNTSIQSGDQKELALRAWELTREGAPFKLVRNVFKVCAEAVKKGPKDEDDS